MRSILEMRGTHGPGVRDSSNLEHDLESTESKIAEIVRGKIVSIEPIKYKQI